MITFSMHPAQKEIYSSLARFKVVAAGRRFGKSYLAAMMMLLKGMQTTHTSTVSGRTYDVAMKPIYYVGPTLEQARRIIWDLLVYLGGAMIAKTHENSSTITLVNGRKIYIRGSDDPNTLRGSGYHFVVMDEYAWMKPEVWEKVIRPALADVEGEALFIGTPEGENHFFDLYCKAMEFGLPEWQAWQFYSVDNPTLNPSEIEAARRDLSTVAFAQEYEASFESASGAIFNPKWWIIDANEPPIGDVYIAADLAGFSNAGTLTKKELKIRDESAIAVVKVGPDGWWVKDIIHGQWDVRETALRLMLAYRDHRPVAFGIEKGMAKDAVLPYLDDEQGRLGVYFSVQDLTHGNTRKPDRIRWALQGRAEKGRIKLNDDPTWTPQFIRQSRSFPSPLVHDDLLDALAYIDQLASVVYFDESHIPKWEPLDDIAGF